MAKVNLDQTKLNHVSEIYSLSKCTSKPGYEGTFVWSKKWSYFEELNK